MKKQKGFSLIELLIVVAIILIIAAIAIPNLLKARMAANEASAAGALRTYTTAFVSYATQCPATGFPGTLVLIGPGDGSCTGGANLVDNLLGIVAATKSGYKFAYTAGTADASGRINTYTVTGAPVVCNKTGLKTYFSDESGVIRYDNTAACAAAVVTSAPLA